MKLIGLGLATLLWGCSAASPEGPPQAVPLQIGEEQMKEIEFSSDVSNGDKPLRSGW